MGGCFGNSPYDRSMENQLFRWLDSQENDCTRGCCACESKEECDQENPEGDKCSTCEEVECCRSKAYKA